MFLLVNIRFDMLFMHLIIFSHFFMIALARAMTLESSSHLGRASSILEISPRLLAVKKVKDANLSILL